MTWQALKCDVQGGLCAAEELRCCSAAGKRVDLMEVAESRSGTLSSRIRFNTINLQKKNSPFAQFVVVFEHVCEWKKLNEIVRCVKYRWFGQEVSCWSLNDWSDEVLQTDDKDVVGT